MNESTCDAMMRAAHYPGHPGPGKAPAGHAKHLGAKPRKSARGSKPNYAKTYAAYNPRADEG